MEIIVILGLKRKGSYLKVAAMVYFSEMQF